MSNRMHERSSKTEWDTIVFKSKLRTYVKFKQNFKPKDHVFRYMSSSAHCYHISEKGLYRSVSKHVDGLILPRGKTL